MEIHEVLDEVFRREEEIRNKGEFARNSGDNTQAGYYHGGADALRQLRIWLEESATEPGKPDNGGP